MKQLIEVTRDLPGGGNALLLRYWRTSERKPDQGRVTIRVNVLRDTDADGAPEIIAGFTLEGEVRDGLFERTRFLPVLLREGDRILVAFRLRKMPRIPRRESAFAETILQGDE